MYYIGIDIGSTATKTVVLDENKEKILHMDLRPTGWDSRETANGIKRELENIGYADNVWTATGYGRISVDFADKVVTEITCHAKGAVFLAGEDITVIDIGGQDTKVITMKNGMVQDFMMNDKCSAGTGRFLEIMANTLGVGLDTMFELAAKGDEVEISSMCTVFAESEIISLIGKGCPKEDIARGVVDSIVKKVSTQTAKHRNQSSKYFLTGGFSVSPYMVQALSEKLEAAVMTHPHARFAGALGAALLGKKKKSS